MPQARRREEDQQQEHEQHAQQPRDEQQQQHAYHEDENEDGDKDGDEEQEEEPHDHDDADLVLTSLPWPRGSHKCVLRGEIPSRRFGRRIVELRHEMELMLGSDMTVDAPHDVSVR